jgi:nitroimidazol reductase NimA-like FMN-containing flavoprotein (pyridoxamine 5'-phosphate oxidase superfamily)
MDSEELWAWVSDSHTGIFITVRRDGTPIALPLWYVVIDRKLYTHSGGKKLARIRHNDRASVLIESGVRWVDLKAVHMTGRIRALDPSEARWDEVRDALDAKYAAFRPAADRMPASTAQKYASDGRVYLEFTPDDRILNWDNSKLGLG